MIDGKPRKMAVLMGGRSSEREISLKTGEQISQRWWGRGMRYKRSILQRILWENCRDLRLMWSSLPCTVNMVKMARFRTFRAAWFPYVGCAIKRIMYG